MGMGAVHSGQLLPQRLPEVGELVLVRSRRWLVDEVEPAAVPGHSPVITLACADDDAQARRSRSTGTTSPTV